MNTPKAKKVRFSNVARIVEVLTPPHQYESAPTPTPTPTPTPIVASIQTQPHTQPPIYYAFRIEPGGNPDW